MSEDKTLLRALCDALSPFVPPEHDVLDAAEAVMAAIGIPAATLSALRSGEMVVVPREMTREMRQAFHAANEEFESGSIYPESSPDYQWRAMLAAAKDARHD